MMFRASAITSILSALVVVACSDTSASTTSGPLAKAGPVVEQHAKNVHANYVEALDKARLLATAIDAFVAAPSTATQDAAKAAWIAARKPYTPSEAYRFYGGPIDDEKTGPEGALNAWPLDENFIDYTADDDKAGIVNRADLMPDITADGLRGENEKGGDQNIATGYHAIEFLLWGQDVDPPSAKTSGHRPFTDFVIGAGGTASNQARRGKYLQVVAAAVVSDLESLVEAWAPDKDNYARTFVADPKVAVTHMLTGLGAMANAELSGERMTVAFKNRDQENEHSCFSDTTNADIQGNAQGIENVYLGRYGAIDGPGLDDLVRAVDPALDAELKKAFADTAAALVTMQAVPFDFAIASADGSPEREAVLKVIKAIKAEAPLIVRASAVLGVTFKLEEPSEDL